MAKTNRRTRTKATRNSDVKGAMKLFDKLMAEKKPAVPEGFTEAVESSITETGADAVNRRMATAFLSKPFKVTAEKIRDDRDVAKAFAAAVVGIRESAQRYKELADLMETAGVRMQIALCQREDMKEILAEAARE